MRSQLSSEFDQDDIQPGAGANRRLSFEGIPLQASKSKSQSKSRTKEHAGLR